MKFNELEKLAADIMHDAIIKKETAGMNLLVLKDGKPVLSLADGFADLETKQTMKYDTILRLYSMSKPVTAAAVMLLMQRGLIDLQEPVSKYIPTYAHQTYVNGNSLSVVQRQMTIHDLLCMTSGLPYGSDSASGKAIAAVTAEMDNRLFSDNPMTTQEFASRVGLCPLEFEPSRSCRYGFSADILGAIVEIVSQKSFAEFLQDEFFNPLEMEDTGFFVPEEKQDRLSSVYEASEDGLKLFTQNTLGIRLQMDKLPAFQSGGAGLASTLPDYSHFASMLLNGGRYKNVQILEPEIIRFFTNASLLPWQQEALIRNWGGLEGYSYGNLMRIMKDPSQAVMYSTIGEYGWDGWLGAYFSNHPGHNITFLSGMQLTGAGTTHVLRKLRNVILPQLV